MLSVLMGKFIEKHVTKQALTEMKKTNYSEVQSYFIYNFSYTIF